MFDTFDIKENDDATTEITGELPVEHITTHEEAALIHLGKDIAIDGFRKGKVPVGELKKHVPEAALWQEMSERALGNMYPRLLAERQIKAIGRPHITITKMAPNNPLGFKITTPVLPDITLPDYKTLATTHPQPGNVEVADEEVQKAIDDILTRVHEAEKASKKKEGDENIIVPKPELTDELVQKLGDYKDVDHFKTALRSELRAHKHRSEQEKHRIGILEAIMNKTDVTIPDILIEAELGKMLAQFKSDVSRVGMKFEDYLKQIDKTEEELKKQWRMDAEKRAKSQFVLNKIAAEERIVPDEKEVEKQVVQILSQQKTADPTFDEQKNKESIRIYVATLLMNEAVFKFLEEQVQKN